MRFLRSRKRGDTHICGDLSETCVDVEALLFCEDCPDVADARCVVGAFMKVFDNCGDWAPSRLKVWLSYPDILPRRMINLRA